MTAAIPFLSYFDICPPVGGFEIFPMILETYEQPWDFKLLDTGSGYRLEQWGQAVLARPDPQVIWPKSLPDQEWNKANAIFKSASGDEKGKWEIKKPLPSPWVISWQGVKFKLKLSPFKHTGLFAEQAAQWGWMLNLLSKSKVNKVESKSQGNAANLELHNSITGNTLKVLNLFAYTGGATMVLAKAGCQVTHVDASKPALTWANENYKLNFQGLGTTGNRPKDGQALPGPTPTDVRWILDDAVKFVKREIRRGSKYDGIIMDPPAFGHSPTGKTWRFNNDLPGLLKDCVSLLSDNAKFLVINGYATNSSAIAINNLLEDTIKQRGGKIEFGELCLKQKSGRLVSTGIFARWSR